MTRLHRRVARAYRLQSALAPPLARLAALWTLSLEPLVVTGACAGSFLWAVRAAIDLHR